MLYEEKRFKGVSEEEGAALVRTLAHPGIPFLHCCTNDNDYATYKVS